MSPDEMKDSIQAIAAMPVGMKAVLALQELFHRDSRIQATPWFIKLAMSDLGVFIAEKMTEEQYYELSAFSDSLHDWQPNQDSPYKEICSICGRKRKRPKESV